MPVVWQHDVELKDFTTLGIGGKAQDYCLIEAVAQWREVSYGIFGESDFDWHHSPVQPLPTPLCPYYILGKGSNVLINSQGLAGKVLHVKNRGMEIRPAHTHVDLRIQAGEAWPEVVDFTVQEKLHGLETLAGIPSSVGAAAVQNIGAYGSDLASVVTGIEYYDLALHDIGFLRADQCGFTYRGSIFKQRPHWAVTYVNLRLVPATEPVPLFYHDLQQALGTEATVAEIWAQVKKVRQRKGMIFDPQDPLTHTTGSFFMNPILSNQEAEQLKQNFGDTFKLYPYQDAWKASAAQLIEQAGFPRGYREGEVGLSPNHALAIVNYGHATSDDVKALAAKIQRGVQEKFKLTLTPETVFFD